MTRNTYAINTTRGKEFAVESDLIEMGLHPWVPRRLCVKSVKGKTDPVWYEKPYVGKMMFCTFPAVYFRDVVDHKHIIGKPIPLGQRDIEGKGGKYLTHPKPNESTLVLGDDGAPIQIKPVYGLRHFKQAVEAEYEDMVRKRENSSWVCAYAPGQALRILSGPFEGFLSIFKDSIRRARDESAEVRVEVDIFGRATSVSVTPDMVERA